MSGAAAECIVLPTEQLLPAQWRSFTAEGAVRAFNPALLRDGDGWIFAYRVVGPDGRRRIAICRLDAARRVVAGSPQPLTDRVRFRRGAAYPEIATQWLADPRLYRFGGRLFVYWNSGWHEPHNCQFLQELEAGTLAPIGHPRELVLQGERQKLEKNWTFFEGVGTSGAPEGRLFCLYSITPHRVLEFSLEGDGDLRFQETVRHDWTPDGYPVCHGGLRGGAPPVPSEGRFWVFCHSVHDGAGGYRYAPAAYSFSAQPPFAPLAGPASPLDLGNPFGERRTHARLNPAVGEVIYPCGAARDGARWLISHGINDEHCAITSIDAAAVAATLRPIAGAAQAGVSGACG